VAPTNGPGRPDRPNGRAPAVERETPGAASQAGAPGDRLSRPGKPPSGSSSTALGFKISDEMKGRAAFLRCSEDHHNVLVQRAPLNFLHHNRVGGRGRGRGRPGRLGDARRPPGTAHLGAGPPTTSGSNFFWYLREPRPATSPSTTSDLDCIVDDALWQPAAIEGARAPLQLGSPRCPPPSLAPDDLAELMTGSHAPDSGT